MAHELGHLGRYAGLRTAGGRRQRAAAAEAARRTTAKRRPPPTAIDPWTVQVLLPSPMVRARTRVGGGLLGSRGRRRGGGGVVNHGAPRSKYRWGPGGCRPGRRRPVLPCRPRRRRWLPDGGHRRRLCPPPWPPSTGGGGAVPPIGVVHDTSAATSPDPWPPLSSRFADWQHRTPAAGRGGDAAGRPRPCPPPPPPPPPRRPQRPHRPTQTRAAPPPPRAAWPHGGGMWRGSSTVGDKGGTGGGMLLRRGREAAAGIGGEAPLAADLQLQLLPYSCAAGGKRGGGGGTRGGWAGRVTPPAGSRGAVLPVSEAA